MRAGEYSSEQRLTARCRSQISGDSETSEEGESSGAAAGAHSLTQDEDRTRSQGAGRSSGTDSSSSLERSCENGTSLQAASTNANASILDKEEWDEVEVRGALEVLSFQSVCEEPFEEGKVEGVYQEARLDAFQNVNDCLANLGEREDENEDEERSEDEHEDTSEDDDDDDIEAQEQTTEFHEGQETGGLVSAITSTSSLGPLDLQSCDSESVESARASQEEGLHISMEPLPRSISMPRKAGSGRGGKVEGGQEGGRDLMVKTAAALPQQQQQQQQQQEEAEEDSRANIVQVSLSPSSLCSD